MMKANIAIALALSMLTTGLLLPFVSEPVLADQTWTGDTTISTPQSYSSETITVSGNLTITNSLTLAGITLVMATPSNGAYHIEVTGTGTLTFLSGTTVRSNNAANHFTFWVRQGGTLTMDASTLQDCGYEDTVGGWPSFGLYIQSNNTHISNSTIKDSYIGIIANNNSSPWIYKNTISDNDATGVAVLGGGKPVIDHNTITRNVKNTNLIISGGMTSAESSPIITNNTISANVDLLNDVNTLGLALQSTGSPAPTPTVMYNDITGHPASATLEFAWGIFNAGPASFFYKNNVTGNGNGIYIRSGTTTISGNLVDNNKLQGSNTAAGYGLADQGTTTSMNNIITRNRYGVLLYDGSHSTFTGEQISQNSLAGVVGDSAQNPFGDDMINCTLAQNFYDVQFAKTLNGNSGGDLDFINTTYDNTTLNITDANAILNVKWQVRVKVTYQSTGAVADGAKVKFFDAKANERMLVLTGLDGWTDLLTIDQVIHTATSNESRSPYNITADKGGKFNYTIVKINRSLELSLPLDDVGTWVRIDDPVNGYVHNKTYINVTGVTEPGVRVSTGGAVASVGEAGNWTANVSLPIEGPNNVVAEATDRGNNKVTANITIVRDTIAPTMTLTWPTEGSLTNKTRISVTGHTSDANGALLVNGLAATIAANGDFCGQVDLAEGRNIVTVHCRDAVWNSVTVPITVYRDTVLPALTITQPANNFGTNGSSVVIKGQTEEGAVVTVGGAQASNPNGNFTATVQLVEGENLITITSKDAAGNVNTVVLTVLRDSAGPALTVTSPKDGTIFNTSLIQVRGSTEEGATVKVNGGGVYFDGKTFSADVSLQAEGNNTIIVEAWDALKNRVETRLTVRLDTVPPELKVTSPLPGSFTNQRTIEVKGKTEPGINVSVNDVVVQTGPSGLFTASIPLDKEGSNNIYVMTWDGGWNLADTSFAVTRDTMVNFNITYPKDGMRTKWKNLTITGDAELNSTITVQGSTVQLKPDGTWSTEQILVTGVNQITFTVKDRAGNTATYMLNVTKVKPAPVNTPGFEAVVLVIVLAAVPVICAYRKR